MKKVNPQQIERLYEFTRQHYVEYYDVQTELVDHLANAIEEGWQENPDQDFEELLQQEFKKFGIFGFNDVVEERQKAMQKCYTKIILKEVKTFLKLPKVLVSILLAWFCFFVISRFSFGLIFLLAFCFLSILVMQIYSGVKLTRLKKAIQAKQKKKYLLEETVLKSGTIGSSLFLPFYLFNGLDILDSSISLSFEIQLLISSVFTLEFLTIYISTVVIPSKKEEILKKAYPEMELS